jgi:hypothetical protein
VQRAEAAHQRMFEGKSSALVQEGDNSQEEREVR